MERRAKVELFEQLRREYEFRVGTIKGVAQKFGVHRRMVRQAVENALPPWRGTRTSQCRQITFMGSQLDCLFFRCLSGGKLIGYAYAFEQATRVRRPPSFAATVGT